MPVAVAGSLLSAPVIRVFYGDDFSDAAFPLAVLLVAAGMRMLGHCANWVLVSNDDERLVVAIYGVCATVSLGLGFALIPKYGIDGALVAEACTQFAFMSTSMALVWRKVGFGVPAAGFLRIAVATIPVAASDVPRRSARRRRPRGTRTRSVGVAGSVRSRTLGREGPQPVREGVSTGTPGRGAHPAKRSN